MNITINQFMWGFQPHFRVRTELRIQQALSQIGLAVDVRVVLVGFALDADLSHQLCIEPEGGPLSTDHLNSVLDRANELFNANPESRTFISDPRSHANQFDELRRQSRGEALIEAIESAACLRG